jgi:hypothetical protein
MKIKFVSVIVLFATPVMAKKPVAKGKGLYCYQGGANAFFPATIFKPSVRAKLVKGQKVTVNLAGEGPISCTVY